MDSRREVGEDRTYRSFQKTLFSVSSSESSSVTPPNSIPIPFVAQSAIVTPDLSAGAYTVDGRLRRSHFTIRGSNLVLLEAESTGAVARERLLVKKVLNRGSEFLEQ